MSEATTTGKIYPAIIAIMRDVKAIGKDRKNEQQGYRFRGVDDVFNEAHPKFSEHGVFIVPEVLEERREEKPSKNGGVLIYTVLKIKYTFYAEDGSNVQCVMIGEGMDSGDKSANKSQSVAIKYAVMQILMIPTEDAKDPENDSPEPAPRKAKPAPETLPSGDAKPSDWQAVVWHMKFGKSKSDDSFKYTDRTLGEIYEKDPEGFAYWCRTFEAKEYNGRLNPKDTYVRKAMDAAVESISKNLAPTGEEAPQAVPLKDVQAELAKKLENHPGIGDFILEKLKKANNVPADVVSLDEVDEAVLKSVLEKFSWFTDRFGKAAK